MTTTFVYFKSGDGESYIEKILRKDIEGKAINVELTDELTEQYEEKFSNEIFSHDHDNQDGHGLIKIDEDGTYTSSYQKSED